MNEFSSDESLDEEEILRNFEEEAKLIVRSETLPKKSSERYLLVYNNYKKFLDEHTCLLSTSHESNLIVYFNILKEKLKPPTLWSIWSMLRKTLNTHDNININDFCNLKSLIKNNAKGYQPKKSLILRWDQIMKFMTEALDDTYLATKVILIFGVCGALRCDEITNMKVKDVEDLGNKFLVTIHYNKNEYPGQFIIGNLFYDKVKKYISLRPSDQFSDRFFIQYQNNKCTRQPIGRHKIGEVPEKIACYLKLENSKRYTGHCFRRTAATLLSESGANMQMIKQLGRWRSDIIAQGYIENSLRNKQLIYDGITHAATIKNSNLQDPTTSTAASSTTVPTIHNEAESILNLDWSDFSEEFTINNVEENPNEVVESGFITANNKKILTPSTNKALSISSNKNKLFFNKPPIKLNFNNQQTNQTPSCKKRKFLESMTCQDENYSNVNKSVTFNNCTFNNCVFNITNCKCDKENHS